MENLEYSVRVRLPENEYSATKVRDEVVKLLDRLVRELNADKIEADWSPLA